MTGIKQITINGIKYDSLADLAHKNHLKPSTVYNRYYKYKNGLITKEEVLKPRGHYYVSLTINGTTYHSLSDIAKKHHIKLNTVYTRYFRYRKGLLNKEDIIKPNYLRSTGIQAKMPNGITANNEFFPDIQSLMKKTGLTRQSMVNRLKRYFKHEITAEELIRPAERLQNIVLAGKKFKDVKDAAKYCNISEATMRNRLYKFDRNDPRIIEVHHVFVIDNKEYTTIDEWAKQNHVPISFVKRYIATHDYQKTTKAEIVQAFNKEKRVITLDGIHYVTIRALEKDSKVSRTTIAKRKNQLFNGEINKEQFINLIGWKNPNKKDRN